MLFNSYIFILLFLPITLILFFCIGRKGYYRIAIAWLVSASLFFYGFWNPIYLVLILASILFNYSIGVVLSQKRALSDGRHSITRRAFLSFGIIVNLLLLGYFKYFNFFSDNINRFIGSNLPLEEIILPLAISFFTFQQIAYLVDAYRYETGEYNFIHYCLFVTFFPQLISGPIVHHKEMMPQFVEKKIFRLNYEHCAVGITIFFIGLFKKVVLADGIAGYSTPVFDAAEQSFNLTFVEAWGGAMAYSFQIYFDFSGYSDMAIGIARMFGIKLPLNFHSPYKAVNIIEFWRRWNITLSRFLRDYLYISLGGNRKGKTTRYINLMITMILGGLWHGANWTFVAWGALHGIYLVINHAWRTIKKSLGYNRTHSSTLGHFLSRTITFGAVVISWSLFRAESFDGAIQMLRAMVGLNGFALPEGCLGYLNHFAGLGDYLSTFGLQFMEVKYFGGIIEISSLIFCFLLVWFMPNTQQFMIRYKPAFEIYRGEIQPWKWAWLQWEQKPVWVICISIMSVLSILELTHVTEFIYFQF